MPLWYLFDLTGDWKFRLPVARSVDLGWIRAVQRLGQNSLSRGRTTIWWLYRSDLSVRRFRENPSSTIIVGVNCERIRMFVHALKIQNVCKLPKIQKTVFAYNVCTCFKRQIELLIVFGIYLSSR
jgi:hypothetical protein